MNHGALYENNKGDPGHYLAQQIIIFSVMTADVTDIMHSSPGTSEEG